MKLTITTVLVFIFLGAGAQKKTNVDYYNGGMKFAQRGNYKEAIQYFDMAIQLKKDDYFSMHNRGIAKSLLKDYQGAIKDFNLVLQHKPDYVEAHIALGNSYKKLTHYDTAITHYTNAIKYEGDNVKAYYFRAYSYEAMMMIDKAAADFKKAFELGAEQLEDQVKYYSDTTKCYPKWYTVGKVKTISTDPTYGFTKKNPIKVGTSKAGGYANVKAYLDQLKDARRKPVQYQRVKACCPHKPKGYKGNVFLEEYKITYNTLEEGTKTSTIYLSYYEADAPKILMGFKSVHK